MCDLNGTQHKKYKIIQVVKRIYARNIGIIFASKLYYTGKRRGQLQYKHFFNILCCMLLTILWPIDSMLWPLFNNIQIQWQDLIWQRVVHSAALAPLDTHFQWRDIWNLLINTRYNINNIIFLIQVQRIWSKYIKVICGHGHPSRPPKVIRGHIWVNGIKNLQKTTIS